MRTRKQVRNFGIDITNYEPLRNSLTSASQNSMKLEILESANNQHICSSQNESQISHKNYKDFKTKYISKNKNKIKGVSRHGAKKKNRKVQQQDIVQERIQQIMRFGYKYYQNLMGQLNYVTVKEKLNSSDHGLSSKDNIELSQRRPKGDGIVFPNCPQLTHSMRNILIHYKMNLRYQTLYMTIYLVDKYCSRRVVNKSEYQLLGMASLFLAGKYEQVTTPKLKKIIALCDELYDYSNVLNMESSILLQLNFRISQPSLNWFIGLQLFSITANSQLQQSQEQQQPQFESTLHKQVVTANISTLQKFKRTCYYISQLCLFQIQILKHYSPQVISNTILQTVSMKQPFLHIDIECSTKYLEDPQLKQMRDCLPKIKYIFGDRLNKKYSSVNFKYPDISAINQSDMFSKSQKNHSSSNTNINLYIGDLNQ